MDKLTIRPAGKLTSVSHVGDLIAYPNEGGYTADSLEVDGVYIYNMIATLFGVELHECVSLSRDGNLVNLGRVQITITRLDSDQ